MKKMRLFLIISSLLAVPYGGYWGNGQVMGNWNDHSSFSIDLGGRRTYSMVELYDGVIPLNCVNEPTSDLSGDCKVNFVDFSKMAGEWLDCGLQKQDDCWE